MSAAKDILLQAKGLCAWYGAAQILYDVNLEVRRGEVVALMGRNGAGKSTTLKTLIGMIDTKRGHVSFLGTDISTSETHHAARMGISLLNRSRHPPLIVPWSLLATHRRAAEPVDASKGPEVHTSP